jgi:SAM-dependent methyltransferase
MRPRSDTLLIWTGAPCSYGCGACPIDPGAAPAGLQVAGVRQGLSTREREGRLVVLVGGEPFLRPDLPRLLAAIRLAGCLPGIVTTGRPLVYPRLRERLRQGRLAYLRIQLFGVGEAHDRATAVPGAFDQALAGLQAWMAEGKTACDIDVALNVRRRPFGTIVSEVEVLAREIPSPDVQIVIAIEPAARLEPHATELQRAIAALADWNDDASRPLLAWEGLSESVLPASCMTVPPLPPAFAVTTPLACCLGAVEEPVEAAPGSSRRTRANSFNFVRTDTSVPWTAEAGACTAYLAAGGADPLRALWLVEDDRLVLHVTDTGDFEPAEIARVKDEWSHLFLDRSSPGVLDDFTEGMRRVLPDTICESCENRPRCGRRFHVVDGPPFASEEAWIASYIAGLRGRVLDVGCGEQLYRDRLAPLLRSGAVQYTGLDPDEPSLAGIRAALPEGRFLLTGIEDFRGEPASYDHILCLRSLNHVVCVDEALARMAELLKPGGQLLIVETTPFAMLRRPEQVAAADRAPRAGHQHFRNLASTDVLPFARRRALRLLEHHPAGLQTTNEWILLLERAPATV